MKHINEIQTKIENYKIVRQLLLDYEEQLDAILKPHDNAPSVCSDNIDFDYLTRDQVMAIMLLFGGKWNKSPSGTEKMNYTSQETFPRYGNLHIRCYSAEPPPSCRIIREEVDVPERIIPAHKETRIRMECAPEDKETEAQD